MNESSRIARAVAILRHNKIITATDADILAVALGIINSALVDPPNPVTLAVKACYLEQGLTEAEFFNLFNTPTS